MKHRFSNSYKIRAEILALAGYSFRQSFKTWESIPIRLRLLILEHITLTVQEVFCEV